MYTLIVKIQNEIVNLTTSQREKTYVFEKTDRLEEESFRSLLKVLENNQIPLVVETLSHPSCYFEPFERTFVINYTIITHSEKLKYDLLNKDFKIIKEHK